MAETRDDTHPLALDGHLDPVAAARVVRKILLIVTPVIVGLISAVWGAIHTVAGDAQARTQGLDKQAHASYEVTAKAVDERDRLLADLAQRVRRLEAQQHPPARVGSKPRVPAPVPPPPPPPKAMPASLDQAVRQAQAPAPPAPAPRGDGGGP